MVFPEAVHKEGVIFVPFPKGVHDFPNSLLVSSQSQRIDKSHTQIIVSILISMSFCIIGLILCCALHSHPLADKVHIAVHKVDNAVVVLGIGVAYTTTLHYFECL